MEREAARPVKPAHNHEKDNQEALKKRKRLSTDPSPIIRTAEKMKSQKMFEEDLDSSDEEVIRKPQVKIVSRKNLTQTGFDSYGSSDSNYALYTAREKSVNLKTINNDWITKKVNALIVSASKGFAVRAFLDLKNEIKAVKDEMAELKSIIKAKNEMKAMKDKMMEEVKSIIKAEVGPWIKDELNQLRNELRVLIKEYQGCTCSANKPKESSSDCETNLAHELGLAHKDPVSTKIQTESPPVTVVNNRTNRMDTIMNKSSFNNLSEWAGDIGSYTSQQGSTSGDSFSINFLESSLFKKDILIDEFSNEETFEKTANSESLPTSYVNVEEPILIAMNSDVKTTQNNASPTVSLQKMQSKSLRKKKDAYISRPHPEIDPKAIFKFGSVELTGEEVLRCKHTGKISSLAVDLFSALFTAKEMAINNLTGRVPNGHVQLFPKGKLDEARITGIIDYVASFLRTEISDRLDVDREVKTAISNKLSNFAKTAEGKQLLQEEYARRQTEKNSIDAAVRPDQAGQS